MIDSDSPTLWEKEVLELGTGGLHRRAVALLSGFEVTGSAIAIGPIRIRRIDEPTDRVLSRYQLSQTKYAVLELKYLDREGGSSVYAEPALLLERAFVATQVVVDSWVGMSQVHHFTDEGCELAITGSRHREVADSWHPVDEPSIPGDEIFGRRFRLAFRAQSGLLGPSLRRFSHGCSVVMEESIVDFVIVLEALLGRGIQDEITHRISVRGALLLASNREERLDYYKSLKYLYKVRSALVHGNAEDITKPRLNEQKSLTALGLRLDDEADFHRYHVADLARRVARRTLWVFLEEPAKLDENWLLQLELGLV